MQTPILQSERFYCTNLNSSASDKEDIDKFTIDRDEGAGLLNYLQNYALKEEQLGIMRTYIVRDKKTSETVGYFSLKSGLISINERIIEVKDESTGERKNETTFDTIPGIELANFAINSSFIHNHSELKGIGIIIFNKFILPIVRHVSEYIGVKILYIFALPEESLIKSYHERYGFDRLGDPYEDELHKRVKPFYDRSCTFMFLNL